MSRPASPSSSFEAERVAAQSAADANAAAAAILARNRQAQGPAGPSAPVRADFFMGATRFAIFGWGPTRRNRITAMVRKLYT